MQAYVYIHKCNIDMCYARMITQPTYLRVTQDYDVDVMHTKIAETGGGHLSR